MINTIDSRSEYLEGGYTRGGPTFNGIAKDSGNVRYNPQRHSMQTFNGVEWVDIARSVSIGLSQTAEDVLSWAKSKMEQEAKLQEAMEKHPGLKDAYEKFEIMKMLCVDK
jgi:hypothetical protein